MGGIEGAQIVEGEVVGWVRTAGQALHKRALAGLAGAYQHHGRRIAEGREEARGKCACQRIHDQPSASWSLYTHLVVDF